MDENPSHPVARALLAGLMQGRGERERDEALQDAGRRLAEAAILEAEARRKRLEPFHRLLVLPPRLTLEALPRPAPPQARPRPWWRWW